MPWQSSCNKSLENNSKGEAKDCSELCTVAVEKQTLLWKRVTIRGVLLAALIVRTFLQLSESLSHFLHEFNYVGDSSINILINLGARSISYEDQSKSRHQHFKIATRASSQCKRLLKSRIGLLSQPAGKRA